MKGVAIFRKFLTSTWFLAVIPAILIIILLPDIGSKYLLDVEQNFESNPEKIIYMDLNSDSVTENILVGKGVPFYFVSVRDNSNIRFYDQWNLPDSIDPFISDVHFANYDHDRFSEIYVFTHSRDSLFLNVNEFFEPQGTKFERLFITNIGYVNGEVTSFLDPIGTFDENEDGNDEYYFGITTAFGQPRKLYYIDITNKKVVSGPFAGNIIYDAEMKDVDGDGKPEIFGQSSSSGNFKKTIPYSDSSNWFMIFNEKLKFEFPPIEFQGYAASLEIHALKTDIFNGYVSAYFPAGMDSAMLESRLMLHSTDGKLVRYRLASELDIKKHTRMFIINHNNKDNLYVLGSELMELNDKFEVIRSFKLPFHSDVHTYMSDIDNDSESEFLFYSDDEELLAVYKIGMKKPVTAKLIVEGENWKFSNYFSKGPIHKFYIVAGSKGFFLKMVKNKYYWLAFLEYPAIYFVVFFFIFVVKKINTRQVEQAESLKQRLITLQLKGIKAQLDPHFTFNTLNSVAALLYLDDRKAAYDYMNKFTQLLRVMLNDAERVYRTLAEEVEFVKTYLDLEKLRFGDKFNFEIKISEGVSQKEVVPKLVLHTFAENAIKHGLSPGTSGGKLEIRVDKENDYIKLSIEDNGIGREKSKGLNKSTGIGLKLTGEFYDILNQINKKPITHLITDLYDKAGEPVGTRVEVWVPVEERQDMV